MTKMETFSVHSEALNFSQNFPGKNTPDPLDMAFVDVRARSPNLKNAGQSL